MLLGALGALGAEVACSSFEAESSGDDASVADAPPGGGDASFDADTGTDARVNEPFRYVFVSSEARTGTFPEGDGGVALGVKAADTLCTTLADRSKVETLHGRTWAAWLSTTTEEARSRIGAVDGKLPTEIRAVNGTVIFPRNFTFEILSEAGPALPMDAIRLDQNGKNDGALSVWTGTNSLGKHHGASCANWTFNQAGQGGAIGANDTVGGWTVSPTVTSNCDQPHHVYCFETR